MTIILDVLTLWLLTCLFFQEPIKWRIGHIMWIGLLASFIYMSGRKYALRSDLKIQIDILPINDIVTLIVICVLVILANSYLFKRSHVTILVISLLSLMVWLIVRIVAVLLVALLSLSVEWNHFVGVVLALLLFYLFKRYVGYVSFDNMTLLQQFVVYSLFLGSMVAYSFYLDGISILMQQILIGCSVLLCVFFTLFIYTQKRQQAMMARLQAAEEYVPIIDELVMEVRSRQHEFANKMLAVTSILETAETLEEARASIAIFTDNVRLQPYQEQLLTMEHKIVAGFLYAKLRRAEQMGIHVDMDFAVPSYKMPCEEVDLVEVLGILLDNAFEASESGETVTLVFRLVDGQMRLEVSNPVSHMTNEQMMQMFDVGYSTKGEKRGFGLHNLKQIAKQYNAKIILKNEAKRLTVGLQFTV